MRSPTSPAASSAATALASLSARTPSSMNELISGIDPGTLPARIRATFSDVGRAIGMGWKPGELAKELGVSPSVLSEALAELRVALGLLNGIFPRASSDQQEALLGSIAEHGIEVDVVVDEQGIIDGYARVAACETLAWIVDAAERLEGWEQIAAAAAADRAHAVDAYGRGQVDDAVKLADFGLELVLLAGERRWADPPIDRRKGLADEERRQLAVTLNAHRRHLSRGELRQVVEMELMINPDRPNTAIGELVGCTPQWVGQIRQQLAEDEALLANPQGGVEAKAVSPYRPVAELDCPHCAFHLVVTRAGRDFALELTA